MSVCVSFVDAASSASVSVSCVETACSAVAGVSFVETASGALGDACVDTSSFTVVSGLGVAGGLRVVGILGERLRDRLRDVLLRGVGLRERVRPRSSISTTRVSRM